MGSGLSTGELINPAPFQILKEARGIAEASVPEGLLELCRHRLRTLLGVPPTAATLTDARIASLPDYPTSPLFDETERAALAFTEQYVMDVANMPDDLVSTLQDRLGPDGLYALAMALYVIDQSERLDLTAGIVSGGSR